MSEWIKFIGLQHIYFDMSEKRVADILLRNAIQGILDWIGSEAIRAAERLDYERCKYTVGWQLRDLRGDLVMRERMGYLSPEEKKLLNILRKKWSDIIDTICETNLGAIRAELGDVLRKPAIEYQLMEIYEDKLVKKLADVKAALEEVIREVA